MSVAERNYVISFICAWIEPVDIKRTLVGRFLTVTKVKVCKEPE
jgi:hypothetical protein